MKINSSCEPESGQCTREMEEGSEQTKCALMSERQEPGISEPEERVRDHAVYALRVY